MAAHKKPLIGLSLDTLKEARWQGDRDMFVKRARELGAEVLDLAADSDDSVQIGEPSKSLITNKVDVLVVVAARRQGHGQSREHGARRRHPRDRLRFA